MPTLHVITNAQGKIVAAMHAHPDSSATLLPLADQKMHKVEDVPVEVAGLINPVAFHKAITEHFNKKGAKVTPMDPHKGHAPHGGKPTA